MQLPANYLKNLIETVITNIRSNQRVICLGQNIFNWHSNEIVSVLKESGISINLEVFEKIRTYSSFQMRDLFELINVADFNQYDTHLGSGADVVLDFNTLIKQSQITKADFVFEFSFIEHLFDIKNAFFNMVNLTNIGGVIHHLSPLNAFNHGFYNLSLNTFFDFYSINGFSNLSAYILRAAENRLVEPQVEITHIDYSAEPFSLPIEALSSQHNQFFIGFTAKKISDVDKLEVPSQSIYSAIKRLNQ